jgi:hypothetical protein
MRDAVIYARVPNKDQEKEGFSIPAQLKFLREYALRNAFRIAREFVDVETAKMAGRKKFGEMLAFLSREASCRVLIVEKTDRLYRNFRDCVTLEDMDVEIHLPKEGQIISKESKIPGQVSAWNPGSNCAELYRKPKRGSKKGDARNGGTSDLPKSSPLGLSEQ